MLDQSEQKQVATVESSNCDTNAYQPNPDHLEKYAEITRNLIIQENARLNERTTWLLQLQGLLFAALAFAWGKESLLIWLLSGVGILSSLAIGKALHSAIKAIDSIEMEWRSKGIEYKGPRIIGLGRYDAWRFERQVLLLPAYNLPIIFVTAWIIVLWYLSYK